MTQRFKKKEVKDLFSEFEKSDLSMNKFADLHKIPRSTFHRHYAKYKKNLHAKESSLKIESISSNHIDLLKLEVAIDELNKLAELHSSNLNKLHQNLSSSQKTICDLYTKELAYEKKKFRLEIASFAIAFIFIVIGFCYFCLYTTEKEIRYITAPTAFIENNN